MGLIVPSARISPPPPRPVVTLASRRRCDFRNAETQLAAKVKDLLMGLFRGAVFGHGRGDQKQPIKQPIEMPTSTMALMGRFPSLMGRFPTIMGRFTDFVLRGRFAS